MFDDYVDSRAKELAQENSYLFNTENFKRHVYFLEDQKETLNYVHRQANDHKASDFKDSELMLQDFINRYSDSTDPKEMFD